MKKKLDTTALSQELTTGSDFFRNEPKVDNINVTNNEQTNERTTEQSENRITEITNNTDSPVEEFISEIREEIQRDNSRRLKRLSHDLYEDQEERMIDIQHLFRKKFKKKLPASKIVRDALENYLPELKALLEQK